MKSGRSAEPPLVTHVVYRFDTGGLENGVVNLINHMPASAFRHAVVALTEVVPTFAQRIQRDDVQFVSLHKPPGHGAQLYPRLWRLFREMRPQILHTRNLAALECQVPALLAGVPVRLHGEHGRDTSDPDGTRKRYQLVRRLYKPFVHHYIALSRDLADYLRTPVDIAPGRITQIYNGVDESRFAPVFRDERRRRQPISGCPFRDPTLCIVGTVGRMSPEKDQLTLARAFVHLMHEQPALRDCVRLVLVGQGVLRREVQAVLDEAGLSAQCWLAGERQDVPDVMRGLDVFVLPSLAEGISNTILEAMASALPVVATKVGGNADLVQQEQTGLLVEAADPVAMSKAIGRMAQDAGLRHVMGVAGRERVQQRFSLQAMVAAYQDTYQTLLDRNP